jgi:hypothetical protein
VRDHGFRVVERTVDDDGSTQWVLGSVTYLHTRPGAGLASSSSYVTLSYAPVRLELELMISNKPRRGYAIEELHALIRGGPLPPCVHGLRESKDDCAKMLVEFARLASILQDCGARFFDGDDSLWMELDAQRAAWGRAKEDERTLDLSEQAFKSQNWQSVVTLLEPIAARLGRTATARLAYARKKLLRST